MIKRKRMAALALVVLAVEMVSGCSHPIDYAGTPLNDQPAPDFRLTDQSGKPFRLHDQTGNEVVLFFGYTHCPDVCPTTLATIAQAYRHLSTSDRARVRVVFVTVDPTRDTPSILKRYVHLFDPSFVGLTGTKSALETVERAYHVWAQQLPNTGSSAGYLVAHSSNVYLIDAQGRERVLHDWNDSRSAIASDMRKVLS